MGMPRIIVLPDDAGVVSYNVKATSLGIMYCQLFFREKPGDFQGGTEPLPGLLQGDALFFVSAGGESLVRVTGPFRRLRTVRIIATGGHGSGELPEHVCKDFLDTAVVLVVALSGGDNSQCSPVRGAQPREWTPGKSGFPGQKACQENGCQAEEAGNASCTRDAIHEGSFALAR